MKTEDIKSMAAAWAQVQEASKKKLDPVGQADADIDNDGDVDNSDKYLHNRRKAISKNMKKDEVEINPKKKEDKADAAQAVESVAPIDEISNEKKKEYLRHVADKGGMFRKPKPASLYGLERKSKEELKKIKRPTIGDVLDRAEKLNKRKKIALKVANSLTKKEDKADAAQAVESVAPIYAKILEKRDMHTKGATPPEKMTDKFTAQDKKMADGHGGIDGNESGIDGAKAAEGTAKAIAASGKTSSNHNRAADNKAGDKNIINKVTQDR